VDLSPATVGALAAAVCRGATWRCSTMARVNSARLQDVAVVPDAQDDDGDDVFPPPEEPEPVRPDDGAEEHGGCRCLGGCQVVGVADVAADAARAELRHGSHNGVLPDGPCDGQCAGYGRHTNITAAPNDSYPSTPTSQGARASWRRWDAPAIFRGYR
jgi:hypothetical protein